MAKPKKKKPAHEVILARMESIIRDMESNNSIAEVIELAPHFTILLEILEMMVIPKEHDQKVHKKLERLRKRLENIPLVKTLTMLSGYLKELEQSSR